MENKIEFNPDLGTIAMSAFIIEKVHSCADCPIRKLRSNNRSRYLPGSITGTRPGGQAGKPIRRGYALSAPDTSLHV